MQSVADETNHVFLMEKYGRGINQLNNLNFVLEIHAYFKMIVRDAFTDQRFFFSIFAPKLKRKLLNYHTLMA